MSKPRLLVVDDIADNRIILSRRLIRHGFEVVEAQGGHAALELVAQQTFDLVLLDIRMPDLDGIEVLKRIRQSYSPSALPVIMVTANGQSTDTVTALQLGANDYITKPVDFPVALARIEAQLMRKLADEALRLTNEQLEHRVEIRTAELTQANEQLASETAERQRSKAQLEHMAHYDALTELANRILFQDRLQQAVLKARQDGGAVAVLCLNLDHFKDINDSLGHAVGDSLLRSFAQRLLTAVRAKDTVARLGGDEFAIIEVEPAAPDSTGALSQRLLDLFKKPFEIGADVCYSTVSIGAAVFPQDAATADDLLRAADIALSKAKLEGRATYRRFEVGMTEAVEARQRFDQDLRHALVNGEFELHYQPLVDLDTQDILGCEALIRWNHPVRGPVPPSEFIPLAESTRLIVEIGAWVLRTACAEAAHWPARTKIAVNLSPVQFDRPGLVDMIKDALSTTGLDPTRLELEITESVLLGNTEPVLLALQDLKKLGIKISMDDFGTGYSSLGYLRKFPFDKIKVDRSFVTDLGASAESVAIMRAVVGLATGLGMTTLAEGIETCSQFDRLLAEGCSQGQGYYFSRPRPAAEIRAMFDGASHVLSKLKGAAA